MKIAALGDIHGNYQALISVLDHIDHWRPDLVLVLGDIINRGPRSKECLHMIQDRGKSRAWYVIKGNHEGYVLNMEDPALPRTGMGYELRKLIHFTYDSLSGKDIQAVKDMPVEISIEKAGNQLIRASHASTAGDRIGIYPETPGSDMPGLIDQEANLYLVGHTHQPFIENGKIPQLSTSGLLASLLMVISGQHMPKSFSKISPGREISCGLIMIARLQKMIFIQAGLFLRGEPSLTWYSQNSNLDGHNWASGSHAYEQAVLAGKITPEKAVEEFLLNPNIEYKNLSH